MTSKRLREQILHDLRNIAVCINRLIEDLDKVERDTNEHTSTDNMRPSV